MKIKYFIEKGDKFLCIKDYIMDDDSIAYTEGKDYVSESDGNLTDNQNSKLHAMNNEDDFFEHFKFIGK